MTDIGRAVIARQQSRWRRWRCFWSWPFGHRHVWLTHEEIYHSGYAMQCDRCGHLVTFNDYP